MISIALRGDPCTCRTFFFSMQTDAATSRSPFKRSKFFFLCDKGDDEPSRLLLGQESAYPSYKITVLLQSDPLRQKPGSLSQESFLSFASLSRQRHVLMLIASIFYSSCMY